MCGESSTVLISKTWFIECWIFSPEFDINRIKYVQQICINLVQTNKQTNLFISYNIIFVAYTHFIQSITRVPIQFSSIVHIWIGNINSVVNATLCFIFMYMSTQPWKSAIKFNELVTYLLTLYWTLIIGHICAVFRCHLFCGISMAFMVLSKFFNCVCYFRNWAEYLNF